MSNDEGETRDFDELDLPADDLLEPVEEGLEAEPVGEPLEALDAGAMADAGVAAPGEVTAEVAEEELEEELEKKEPGFLENLTKTSPYVVLLGIALAAILIGILCLFLELKSYEFEIQPTQQASMVPAAQSGPPSTTATA